MQNKKEKAKHWNGKFLYAKIPFFKHFLQILLDPSKFWTLKKPLIYASKIRILLINKGFQWWAVGDSNPGPTD